MRHDRQPGKPPRDPILDSINEGVFTVDLEWRSTSFNRAAERIVGIKREEAIGQRCSEVFRWLRADHVRRYWGEPEENHR